MDCKSVMIGSAIQAGENEYMMSERVNLEEK